MTAALVELPDVQNLVTFILNARYVPVHHQKSTYGSHKVSVLNYTQILGGALVVTMRIT